MPCRYAIFDAFFSCRLLPALRVAMLIIIAAAMPLIFFDFDAALFAALLRYAIFIDMPCRHYFFSLSYHLRHAYAAIIFA